jgi:hypothetical protein
MARLYRVLEERLIRRGLSGEHTSGTSTGAPTPDEQVMACREDIRHALQDAAMLITRRRGISGPVRRVIRKLPAGDKGSPRVATVATGHREALAVFIATHAEWLAAQPEAAAIADLFHELSRPGGEAWRAAYSIGPSRIHVGDCPWTLTAEDGTETICGGRLYGVDGEPLVTCSGCGRADTIEQWQRWLYGDTRSPIVDAYAGAQHLSATWLRPCHPGTIRAWQSKGKVGPILIPDPSGRRQSDPDGKLDDAGKPAMVPVMVRQQDAKGRTQYRLADLVTAAEKAWGPAPKVRRAA